MWVGGGDWEERKKEGVHVGRPVPPSISAIA